MISETTAMINECPQCGAPNSFNSNECQYCHSEFIVSSLSSLTRFDKRGVDKYIASYKKLAAKDPNNQELNAALGMCYFKLDLFDFALKFFQKAMDDMVENSDLYFYSAICLFKGKRPFLNPLTTIRNAEEFLDAAISLNSNDGKYYYAHALIKYDYYYQKRLNTSPNFQELLNEAEHYGVRFDDKELVESLLKISF